MAHAISMSPSPDERLVVLKARCVPTPDNQPPPLLDGDLNKVMDRGLYEVTKTGDAREFVDALERVFESRKLSLWLIFDQVTPSGNSLLHVAASSGNHHVMEVILNHFPSTVTWKNSSQDTPLHVAVRNNRYEATEKLIDTQSEVIYWENRDSKCPLYLAVETGSKEILQLLLDHSAQNEAYAVKIQGMSPVFAAVEEAKSDMLELVIDRLPKLLQARDEDGGTPLHSAASVGNVEALRLLLCKCPDLALETDINGSYPIHIVCQRGDVAAVALLKDTWPDLTEITNGKGQNILHVAAKAGQIGTVQYILKTCSELVTEKLLNSKDVDGNTPLHLASIHSHCKVLRSLTTSKFIILKLLTNDKSSALDVAMEPKSFSMNHSAFRGRNILRIAGVRRGNKVRDIQSPGERSCGESKPSLREWIDSETNTRLVVATLVASVTFTAGFTLPGGYNAPTSDPDPGKATQLFDNPFQLFVILDTIAMYSSILAVGILLWGHGSDIHVAVKAHRWVGICLYCACGFMAMAFDLALQVQLGKRTWLGRLVGGIAIPCVPIVMFTVASTALVVQPGDLIYLLYKKFRK